MIDVPFAALPRHRRRRLMWCLGAAGIAQLGPLLQAERQMRRTGGPGIIPFELAGPRRAGEILDAWGEEGRAAARRSLLLDFVFPPTYGLLQALACLEVGDALHRRGRHAPADLAGTIAWSQLIAAGFDYVENVGLLLTLRSGPGRHTTVARGAAATKFALLGLGYGYLALRNVPFSGSARPKFRVAPGRGRRQNRA